MKALSFYFFFSFSVPAVQHVLSIQVHPSDACALEHEHQYGKPEIRVVLAAEPGAFLYYGFDREITKEEFARRIRENTLTEVPHAMPVQKGDVFFSYVLNMSVDALNSLRSYHGEDYKGGKVCSGRAGPILGTMKVVSENTAGRQEI